MAVIKSAAAIHGDDLSTMRGLGQPFGLQVIHAAVLGVPLVEASITDVVLAPDCLDRHTSFSLPQKIQ